MTTLASITSFIDTHSSWALLLLFALLALESLALPLPGETALIACAVLASQGTLSITAVIAVAIAAAIIGDNLGYWTARKGGRGLLRSEPTASMEPPARSSSPRLATWSCAGSSVASPAISGLM